MGRYDKQLEDKEKKQIIEEDGLYFQEPKKKSEKAKQRIVIVLALLIFIGASVAATWAMINYYQKLKESKINVDTDGDGVCDVN